MHVLIIPSEEFIPEYNKLDGIFQYHQASILKEAGYKIGALSVKLSFSAPMIAKGILRKLAGKKAHNATDNLSVSSLIRIAFTKLVQPKKYVTTEIISGIPIYRIDGIYRRPPANNKNHNSWIKAGLSCFEVYMEKEGRPDLIHAHDAIYAGMLAASINEKFGVRYIITEHSSTYALKAVDDGILRRVARAHASASGLYAVSETFAGLLNQLFSFSRFNCLPNVLDQQLEQDILQSAATIAPRKSGKFVFLHIAVFKPVKDQSMLIKAFSKLANHNKDAELWIGGSGELEGALKALTADLGLQEKVVFLGLLSREAVIRQLKQCDCFVLSSKYETFGVVTIEAMLFGKPVIVTRCGVGPSIVTENTGLVVDTENENQFAAAMEKMTTLANAYDPGFISKSAIKNFGKESFLKRINSIYQEAV